jgi:hypothetical protein
MPQRLSHTKLQPHANRAACKLDFGEERNQVVTGLVGDVMFFLITYVFGEILN